MFLMGIQRSNPGDDLECDGTRLIVVSCLELSKKSIRRSPTHASDSRVVNLLFDRLSLGINDNCLSLDHCEAGRNIHVDLIIRRVERWGSDCVILQSSSPNTVHHASSSLFLPSTINNHVRDFGQYHRVPRSTTTTFQTTYQTTICMASSTGGSSISRTKSL